MRGCIACAKGDLESTLAVGCATKQGLVKSLTAGISNDEVVWAVRLVFCSKFGYPERGQSVSILGRSPEAPHSASVVGFAGPQGPTQHTSIAKSTLRLSRLTTPLLGVIGTGDTWLCVVLLSFKRWEEVVDTARPVGVFSLRES